MRNILLPLTIIILLAACNSQPKENANAPDSKQPTLEKATTELDKLLTHFKEKSTFPVIIDSVYISNANKGDSLGGAQVKLIAKKWFHDDSLDVNAEGLLISFYSIDSAESKGAYDKWAKKLDVGMIEHASVYALQRTKLNDSTTLLIWAVVYSSFEADPGFSGTDIYYTLLDRDKVGESYMLAKYEAGADPPSSGETLVNGKLTKDGNILMDEQITTEDSDSLIAEITHNQYQYAISKASVSFIDKKRISYFPRVKIKS